MSVDELRRTLTKHPRRWCRRCGQRRCWVQAEARAQLIIRGELAPAGR